LWPRGHPHQLRRWQMLTDIHLCHIGGHATCLWIEWYVKIKPFHKREMLKYFCNIPLYHATLLWCWSMACAGNTNNITW
jgi:hypothetical protein